MRGGEFEAPYFVASSYGAAHLAAHRSVEGVPVFPNVRVTDGGDIYGVPVLISAAAESRLILIDAASIAFVDGDVMLDRSDVAALQLSDAPASGPQSIVSLWQTNSTAIKATRWVHWQKGRADAVAYMDLSVVSP